ncbi:MAG: PepSY domain-containing protein [Clostridia bacterium]|nr:PepSY domain-containing protein [Clostridia bacterium]
MDQNQNNRVEKKLAQAFDAQAPDCLDAILADCRKKKGKKTQMKKTFTKRLTAIAAAFAILLGAIFAVQLLTDPALTTVAIDVNPSIELNFDKHEKVVSASALNSDAEKILYELELQGKKLEDAVTLIVESMIDKGFISEISNSILVSVDGDGQKSNELRDKIAATVKNILDNGNIESSILSQSHNPDNEIKGLSEKYNISTGKAALIYKIAVADGTHLFEELALLSVNELNILLEKLEGKYEALNKQGAASRIAYIDKETAVASALADLGATDTDANVTEVELDYEHGMMVYEIEIRFGGDEYDYEIDAITGNVIRVEADSNKNVGSLPPRADIITEAEAKIAALKNARVSADLVLSFRTKLDLDDGSYHYDVEFKTADAKYEYEVDAESGKILDKEMKFLNSGNTESTGESTSSPSLTVTKEDAIAIALKHAGVSEQDAKKIEVELDNEREVTFYEVEFKAGGYEYEYKISAEDLSVLHSEKERD